MRQRWVGAVAAVALAVLPARTWADACQPCAERPADSKMHGRSLKSYWGVAKGDPLVLGKAFEQGHLALCGTPDQWEWNMFMGMVSAELGKSLLSRRPTSDVQADSLRTAGRQKLELAGCYFAEAMKHAALPKDREKVLTNRGHYWVEQYNEAINFFNEDALDHALERLDLAILIDPSNCKGYGLKGPTLIKLERYEEAIATLEKGRSICPGDSAGAANLFAALHNRGNEIFNQAAKAEADSTRQRLYGQALDWYRKAAEIDAQNLNNLYQSGIAYLRLIDLGDATSLDPARQSLQAFLDRAEDKEDKAKALYYLTWIEIEAKDWAKAEGYVDQYLAVSPRDADGYRFKGLIAQEKKSPQTSESYIIFYTTLEKGEVVEDMDKLVATAGGAGSDLGKVIKEKGKPDEARSYVDQSGRSMVSAFYWSKGEGYAFYGGLKRGAVTFPAQNP